MFSSEPIRNAGRIQAIMGLLATRAASELERRIGDEALRASEQRTRQIIDNALDAVISMDMRGDITGWNPQAEKTFGWSAEQVLGSSLAESIIPLPMRPRHHAGMQRFMETGESPFLNKVIEVTALRSDGSEFPIEMTIAETEVSGEQQFSAFVRDITERKQTEAHLQSAMDDLAHRNRELQDFAFVASHDLQEPLRKIRAFSDRLLARYAGQLDEQGREYLTRSDRAAERMQTLISDLLSYTRVGSRVASFNPTDLSQIMATVIEDLESRLESSSGHVDVDPLPIIEADPTQMRQLFQNLISNSLKFRDPARPPRVRVWAEPGSSKRELKILVEDNGIGFDDKYSEKIFAPFQRLHGRQEFEGTGIGLAIVRRIVERHHGSIRATSIPGEGTRFEVSLPRQQPAAGWQPQPDALEHGPIP